MPFGFDFPDFFNTPIGTSSTAATNPYQLAAPTLGELMLRAAGNVMNPNRPIRVPLGFGGQLLGGLSRFGGALAGGMGEAMAAQRADPAQRQYAIMKNAIDQINARPPQMIDPNQPLQLPGPTAPQPPGVEGPVMASGNFFSQAPTGPGTFAPAPIRAG